MADVDGDLIACDYEADRYWKREREHGLGYSDYFGAEAPLRRAVAAAFADLILSLAPGARNCVDIGCGGGYLVDAFSRRGIAAMGVDASGYAIDRARKTSAGRFERLAIDQLPVLPDGAFDVVTLMDVVEHLTDPVEALRTVSTLVRPFGHLIVLTPRYGGPLLDVQGSEYVHFNVDHVYYFTADTLRAAIGRSCPGWSLTIRSVPEWLTAQAIPAAEEIMVKYRTERDSMIAVVRP
jgi:2-polyprenyl-3-methyl-5-hydroxy-6-metoxy-1,4-benzoquinol methylase